MNLKTKIKYLTYCILVILGFVFGFIIQYTDLMFAVFSFLFFLSIPICIIIFVIIDLIRKTKYWIFPTILFLSIIIGFTSSYYSEKYYSYKTRHNAYEIINVVNKYYADKKRYPDNLQELKPQYLEEIPKIHIGLRSKDFEYTYLKNSWETITHLTKPNELIDNGPHFSLSWEDNGSYYYYDSKEEKVNETPKTQ